MIMVFKFFNEPSVFLYDRLLRTIKYDNSTKITGTSRKFRKKKRGNLNYFVNRLTNKICLLSFPTPEMRKVDTQSRFGALYTGVNVSLW